MIEKTGIKYNLDDISVFIEDTSPNSLYFNISNLPDVIPIGKTAFSIDPPPHLLKVSSEVKVELLDINGKPVYVDFPRDETISAYAEGYSDPGSTSRLISLTIYPTTPYGYADLVIVGEAIHTANGLPIPTDWQGIYNVRWRKRVLLDRNQSNNSRTIFYRTPQVSVSEIQKEYLNQVYTSGKVITLNNPTYKVMYSAGYDYAYVYAIGFKFTQDMIGGQLVVPTPNVSPSIVYTNQHYVSYTAYTTYIQSLVNATTAVVKSAYYPTAKPKAEELDSTAYKRYFTLKSFDESDFTLTYNTAPTYVSSPNLKAFAKFNITNLETFSGDVYKIKVLKKSDGTISGWETLDERVLESTELLYNYTANPDASYMGVFAGQATFNQYWATSSFTFTGAGQEVNTTGMIPTITANSTILFNGLEISSSLNENDLLVNFIYPTTQSYLLAGEELQLSFKLASLDVIGKFDVYASGSAFFNNAFRYEKDVDEGKKSMRELSIVANALFSPLSGQQPYFKDKFGKLLKSFNRGADVASQPKNGVYGIITIPIKVDYSGSGNVLFAVQGGRWVISDVSLEYPHETGFNPNAFSFVLPIEPEQENDHLQFSVKYYNPFGTEVTIPPTLDPNAPPNATLATYEENYGVDPDGVPFSTKILGPNTYIDGTRNVMSGSLWIASQVGHYNYGDIIASGGMELSVDAAYGPSGSIGVGSLFRSIGYQGWYRANKGWGSPGFMIWSGSILPQSGDNYSDVGIELWASGSGMRFRTSGSTLEITGSINATTGRIGGWEILPTELRSYPLGNMSLSGSGAGYIIARDSDLVNRVYFGVTPGSDTDPSGWRKVVSASNSCPLGSFETPIISPGDTGDRLLVNPDGWAISDNGTKNVFVWSPSIASAPYSAIDGMQVLRFDTGSATDAYAETSPELSGFTANTTYAFSFWYRGGALTGSYADMGFIVLQNSTTTLVDARVQPVSGSWKQYVTSFTTPDAPDGNGTVYISFSILGKTIPSPVIIDKVELVKYADYFTEVNQTGLFVYSTPTSFIKLGRDAVGAIAVNTLTSSYQRVYNDVDVDGWLSTDKSLLLGGGPTSSIRWAGGKDSDYYATYFEHTSSNRGSQVYWYTNDKPNTDFNIYSRIGGGSGVSKNRGWVFADSSGNGHSPAIQLFVGANAPLDAYDIGSIYVKGFIKTQNYSTPNEFGKLKIANTNTTPTFQFVDGNQSTGYVLTSDPSGFASWMPPSGAPGIGGGTDFWTTQSIQEDTTIYPSLNGWYVAIGSGKQKANTTLDVYGNELITGSLYTTTNIVAGTYVSATYMNVDAFGSYKINANKVIEQIATGQIKVGLVYDTAGGAYINFGNTAPPQFLFVGEGNTVAIIDKTGSLGLATNGANFPESALDINSLPGRYAKMFNGAWALRIGGDSGGAAYLGMGGYGNAAGQFIARTGNNAVCNHSFFRLGYDGTLLFSTQTYQTDATVLSPTTRFKILVGGTVGINTDSPNASSKLDVVGTSLFTGSVYVGNALGHQLILRDSDASSIYSSTLFFKRTTNNFDVPSITYFTAATTNQNSIIGPDALVIGNPGGAYMNSVHIIGGNSNVHIRANTATANSHTIIGMLNTTTWTTVDTLTVSETGAGIFKTPNSSYVFDVNGNTAITGSLNILGNEILSGNLFIPTNNYIEVQGVNNITYLVDGRLETTRADGLYLQYNQTNGNINIQPQNGVSPSVIFTNTTPDYATSLYRPAISKDIHSLYGFVADGMLKASSDFMVTGSSYFSGSLSSPIYASQTNGWRISLRGEADFRYLYTDQLHAKAFIADLEQAIVGAEIITPGVAKLAVSYVAGTDTQILVEEYPGYPGLGVFVDGDKIRLRRFSRSGGGLAIEDIWLTATRDYSYVTVTNPPTQRYNVSEASTVTPGTIFFSSSLALDYGVPGTNGFVELTTIDGISGSNSPYMQICTFDSVDGSGGHFTTKVREGNLNGISDSDFGSVFAGKYGLYGRDVFLKGNLVVSATTAIALQNNQIAIGNITGTGNNSMKISLTGAAGTSGLFAYDQGGAEKFAIRQDGTAMIAGFGFTANAISSSNDALVLRSNGDITGSQVLFAGGHIGGWNIQQNAIEAPSHQVSMSSNNSYIAFGNPPPTSSLSGQGAYIDGSGKILFGNATGQRIQYTTGNLILSSSAFLLGESGSGAYVSGSRGNLEISSSVFFLNGNQLILSGSINALSGIIGGWNISSTEIYRNYSGVGYDYSRLVISTAKPAARYLGQRTPPSTGGYTVSQQVSSEMEYWSGISTETVNVGAERIAIYAGYNFTADPENLNQSPFFVNMGGFFHSTSGSVAGELIVCGSVQTKPIGATLKRIEIDGEEGEFKYYNSAGDLIVRVGESVYSSDNGLLISKGAVKTANEGANWQTSAILTSGNTTAVYGYSNHDVSLTNDARGVAGAGSVSAGTDKAIGLYGTAVNLGTGEAWAGWFHFGDVNINQGLRVGGDTASPTTPGHGIVFGSGEDTNLYRLTTNTLATDGRIVVTGVSSWGQIKIHASNAGEEATIGFRGSAEVDNTSWVIGKNISAGTGRFELWNGSPTPNIVLSIDSGSGNVAIGKDVNSSANYKLDVSGSAAITGSLIQDNIEYPYISCSYDNVQSKTIVVIKNLRLNDTFNTVKRKALVRYWISSGSAGLPTYLPVDYGQVTHQIVNGLDFTNNGSYIVGGASAVVMGLRTCITDVNDVLEFSITNFISPSPPGGENKLTGYVFAEVQGLVYTKTFEYDGGAP